MIIASRSTFYMVSLAKDYGIAFIKILTYAVSFGNYVIDNYIINPLNFYSKGSLSKTEVEKINLSDYIFTPGLLMGGPKLRGENRWKKYGEVAIWEKDREVPEFKDSFSVAELNSNSNFSELDWYRIKNLDPTANNRFKAGYKEVKDLGFFMHLNSVLFSYKLTINWMLKHAVNVNDYFNKEDFDNIMGLRMVYNFAYADLNP